MTTDATTAAGEPFGHNPTAADANRTMTVIHRDVKPDNIDPG